MATLGRDDGWSEKARKTGSADCSRVVADTRWETGRGG